MTEERKKPGKSETLTIRLDPKTRFMLEFMARLRGQSLTTIVERAIVDAADRATIGEYGQTERRWSDFWNVEEGIRVLAMAEESSLYPKYEETAILDFAKAHRPFFYSGRTTNDAYVRILWPRINEFVEIWNKTKSTDYFAAANAMKVAIKDAGVAAPDWPQKATPTRTDDIDDEIPF